MGRLFRLKIGPIKLCVTSKGVTRTCISGVLAVASGGSAVPAMIGSAVSHELGRHNKVLATASGAIIGGGGDAVQTLKNLGGGFAGDMVYETTGNNVLSGTIGGGISGGSVASAAKSGSTQLVFNKIDKKITTKPGDKKSKNFFKKVINTTAKIGTSVVINQGSKTIKNNIKKRTIDPNQIKNPNVHVPKPLRSVMQSGKGGVCLGVKHKRKMCIPEPSNDICVTGPSSNICDPSNNVSNNIFDSHIDEIKTMIFERRMNELKIIDPDMHEILIKYPMNEGLDSGMNDVCVPDLSNKMHELTTPIQINPHSLNHSNVFDMFVSEFHLEKNEIEAGVGLKLNDDKHTIGLGADKNNGWDNEVYIYYSKKHDIQDQVEEIKIYQSPDIPIIGKVGSFQTSTTITNNEIHEQYRLGININGATLIPVIKGGKYCWYIIGKISKNLENNPNLVFENIIP